MGQHRQRDVVAPAIPELHLILIQLASSKHSSMVPREPATLTISSKAVSAGPYRLRNYLKLVRLYWRRYQIRAHASWSRPR